MKKSIYLIMTGLLFSLSFGTMGNVDHRRAQLIGVIDQELREVTRINQQTNSSNPEMLLRMAELLLEKARLIKEQENTRFLQLSPEQRQRTNRNQFFAESRKHFEQAQKTCEFIIRRFKDFDEKGDVYYIMAYNAKEFNQLDRAQRYFDLAVRHAKPGSTVKQRSELALAEMHFNSNEFSRAIPLYESALLRTRERERWWTKDAYNLSWSYFRNNQVDKAIDLMKQVHELSGNPNFVDMSQGVERDLAYFYTEAGRTSEALQFFQRTGDGEVARNLLRMARNLIGQGKFAAAENALIEAQKQPMDDRLRLEINVELIALYERFGKEEEHLRSAQVLHRAHREGNLNEEQLSILKYQSARMGALLQQQVAGNTYEGQPAIRQAKARRAVAYFDIMADLEPEKAHQHLFLAGETLYAISDVNNSITYYNRAVDLSQERRDRQTLSRAVEGMMMSLGSRGIRPEVEAQHLEKALRLHIAANPRSEQNQQAFERLFNVYMDNGDLDKAERTLVAYRQRYPRAVDKQEAMIATIMEVHQKNNDAEALTRWVNRIEKGEFRVSPQYLEQAKMLLLTLQFESVDKLNTEGEKKRALQGYLHIYRSEHSTPEAKKNAAYTIATLFFELGNPELTHQWSMRALSEMNEEDIDKFASEFLRVGGDMYNRRRFSAAAEIFETTFRGVCRRRNTNKNTLFQNSVLVHLAADQYDSAQRITDEAYRCNVPNAILNQAHLDILKALADDGQWSAFAEYLPKVERNRDLWGELIVPLSRFQDALLEFGRVNESRAVDQKIMRYYNDAKSRNVNIPLEGLDKVAGLKERDVLREISTLRNIQLSFPEDRHTAALKAMFEQLDNITTLALDMMETKSGAGIVNGYKHLVETYDYVADRIRGYTPPDRSPEFIASFKSSMEGLTQPIVDKSREFRTEAVRQIRQSQILAENNAFFLRPSQHSIDVRYFPINEALIMDRGGRQ